jgi:hypothetical protein
MEYILIGYRSTHRRVIINNIYKSKKNFLCNTTIALAWEEHTIALFAKRVQIFLKLKLMAEAIRGISF